MSQLLSTGDVIEVTGLSSKAFRIWLDKKLIAPVEGGTGQGHHARFSLIQCVAISVAKQLRESRRGCALAYVGDVIAAFEKQTEEELLEQFEAGATQFMAAMPAGGGVHLVLDSRKTFADVDVEKTYKDVKKKIAKIERKLKHHVGGRGRGLAGSNKE